MPGIIYSKFRIGGDMIGKGHYARNCWRMILIIDLVSEYAGLVLPFWAVCLLFMECFMSMMYFTVKSKQKELIVRTYRNHTESNCRKRSGTSWELESGQVACLHLLFPWTPQLLVSTSLLEWKHRFPFSDRCLLCLVICSSACTWPMKASKWQAQSLIPLRPFSLFWSLIPTPGFWEENWTDIWGGVHPKTSEWAMASMVYNLGHRACPFQGCE